MNREVEQLRQRAHTLSRALFLRLEEYVDDYPSGVPHRLIALFKDVARESDSVIEEATDVQELALICHTLASVGGYAMSLLDHANTAQTPRGLAQFLDRLRDRLQPSSVLHVTPFADYNYTIGNHFPALNKLLRGTLVPTAIWDEKSKEYHEGLNVVRFPRIERDNVLLHAIFGHEFGHPIADAFLAKDQASASYSIEIAALNEKVKTAFATEINKAKPVERLKIQSDLSAMATEIRRRGIEELLSDAVAVFLFGPSAVFAAAEILVADGLDTVPQRPEYYPPSRFRLRLMCDLLAEDHTKALEELRVDADLVPLLEATNDYLRHLQVLGASAEDRTELARFRLERIAYEWLDKSLPEGLTFARERVREVVFQSATVSAQLPEALQRLHLGLPPSEIGVFPNLQSVDWRTSILAGWMHKIYLSADEKLDWVHRRDRIADVQILSLKGIEDSLLRADYFAEFPESLKAEVRAT